MQQWLIKWLSNLLSQSKVLNVLTLCHFLVFLGLSLPFMAAADPIDPLTIDFCRNYDFWGCDLVYLAPNENYPQKALSIFQKAQAGAYITVGTERGFIAAANSPNVTHLVLLDNNISVVAFNKINTILLKMAKTREDYLRLRFGGGFYSKPFLQALIQMAKLVPARWREHANDPFLDLLGDSKINALEEAYREVFPGRDYKAFMEEARQSGLSKEEINFLETCRNSHEGKTNIQIWDEVVNGGFSFGKFHRESLPGVGKFSGVNYLYNEEAFTKLSRMAKEGRILSGLVDISDPQELSNIVAQLKSQNIRLSVFDISNAWWWRWMGYKGTTNALKAISEIATDDSLLVTTQRNNIAMWPVQMVLERTKAPVVYKAFSFKQIKKFADFMAFAKYLKVQNMIPTFYTQINPMDSNLAATCSVWLKKRRK